MQDLFDEELKELLQGTKIKVPESYDKKVEEILSNISIPSKKRYLHLFSAGESQGSCEQWLPFRASFGFPQSRVRFLQPKRQSH